VLLEDLPSLAKALSGRMEAVFKKMEKLRKRYKCLEVKNQKNVCF
jgi:hypothetical protein